MNGVIVQAHPREVEERAARYLGQHSFPLHDTVRTCSEPVSDEPCGYPASRTLDNQGLCEYHAWHRAISVALFSGAASKL